MLAAELEDHLETEAEAGLGNRAGSGNLHIWDKWIFCLTAA